MKKVFFFCFVLALLFAGTTAKGQMSRWILGSAEQDANGNFYSVSTNRLKFFQVDFTGNSPSFSQRVTGTSINNIPSIGTCELINSITDTAGNVLFYIFANATVPYNNSAVNTANDVLYFVAYDPSTGADEVFGSISPTYGASSIRETDIVRKPGTTDRFYVIFKQCTGNFTSTDQLRYVEVNTSNHTISSPIVLSTGYLNEGMAVTTQQCGMSWRWLFFIKNASGNFELYRSQITGSGISTPVLLTTIMIPGNSGNGQGEIELSPASDKLAIANFTASTINEDVILFDLNDLNGTISNQRWINNPSGRILSLEFSPNGQILYALKAGATSFVNEIYNIPVPTSNYTITSANLLVTNIPAGSSIETAVDGRIYYTSVGYNNHLDYINNPNSATPSVGTTPANSFGPGNLSGTGFPDQIDGENYSTTVLPTMPVVSSSGNDTICSGQSTVLSAAGGNAYQWSGGSTSTSQSITVNPVTTTAYYVTAANGNCISQPDTLIVHVLTSPSVTVSGVTTICSGQSTTLTASGSSSYQWSGGSTATTAAITVSPSVTTAYYVVGTNNNICGSDTDTVTVQVLFPPAVNVNGNTTICAGQSTTLTASGASSYQWSGGSTATTATITVNPSSTTTYYVTGSNGVCAGAADTITVQVLPAPVVNVNGVTTICSGQSTTLTASGASNYQWSGGSSATTSSITVSPSTTTTYYVTGDNGSCPSQPVAVTVQVTPNPVVNISGNTVICNGQSTTLTATGGTSYQWSGPINDTTQSVVVAPTATTTYFVVVSNGNCSSNPASVTVTVDPAPNGNIIGGPPICAGSSATLTALGGVAYQWSTGASTGSITVNPPVTTTYSVVVYNSNGCADTAYYTQVVHPLVIVSAGNDTTICLGDSIQLQGSVINGTGQTWTPTGGPNLQPWVSPTVTTTYYLQGYNQYDCAITDTVVITVSSCSGIEETLAGTSFTVMPNPANDHIELDVAGDISKETRLEIFSAEGKLVFSGWLLDNIYQPIDVTSWVAGVYFVKAFDAEQMSTLKLVIVR